jgi:cell division protein FtsB
LKLAALRAEVERLRNQLATCRARSKQLEERNEALVRHMATLTEEERTAVNRRLAAKERER